MPFKRSKEDTIVNRSCSERLRVNFDLRNSPSDLSQRMLNAIETGSVIPIHRHRHSSETIAVLRGKIRQDFFFDEGTLDYSIIMGPGGDVFGMNVPIGRWHRSVSIESGNVILESKDGPNVPIGRRMWWIRRNDMMI